MNKTDISDQKALHKLVHRQSCTALRYAISPVLFKRKRRIWMKARRVDIHSTHKVGLWTLQWIDQQLFCLPIGSSPARAQIKCWLQATPKKGKTRLLTWGYRNLPCKKATHYVFPTDSHERWTRSNKASRTVSLQIDISKKNKINFLLLNNVNMHRHTDKRRAS